MSEAQWIAAQHKAFTGWINAHLAHSNKKIRGLAGLSDGVKLIDLLEILEKRKLKQFRPTNRAPRHDFDKLETLGLALRHLAGKSKASTKTNLAQELILAADERTLLALAWRLILSYGIAADITIEEQRKYHGTPEDILKQWCNDKLPQGVKVKNFQKSFQRGEIFAMLFNQALKEEEQIQEEDMAELSQAELLDAVFDIAEKSLAIPRLIDVQDLLENPDKQVIMTYVSLIRSSVHASEKTRNQVEHSMNKMQNMFNTLENQLQDRIGFLERTLQASDKSRAAAEAACQREKERREEQATESRQKVSQISAERNSLAAQVESLNAVIAQLQSQQLADAKRIQEKDDMLKASEARVGELMNNTTNNEVVASLNSENQSLKVRINEIQEETRTKERQMEEVFQDIKKKLIRSNTAGKEFRDRARDLEEELATEKASQVDAANTQAAKEAELEDYRAYVAELREQLSNQEVVFKLQLQEMGHLIDEMREREKQTGLRYQKMMEEMQEEHSLQLAKSLQRQEEAEYKSRQAQHHQINPHPNQQQRGGGKLPNDAARGKAASVADAIVKYNPLSPNQWEKTLNKTTSKWGKTKLTTNWKFLLDGIDAHEASLSHNTYQQKGKSKRVLIVDGEEKYNDKSDTSEFAFSLGYHSCMVHIRESKESQDGFEYDLYVDKMPFEDLRREYYIELQRQRAAEKKYGM